MSFVSRQQRKLGPEATAALPDFNLSWIRKILDNSKIKWTQQIPMNLGANTMFEETLSEKNNAILAHLCFSRPSNEPDAVTSEEECWLISLGTGIDGATGRSHGGLNALVLDQISGSVAHGVNPSPNPPATATMTVDFTAEVRTPCVVLVRAWILEATNRKVWVRAVLEDGSGKVCSRSKALFVFAKPKPSNL